MNLKPLTGSGAYTSSYLGIREGSRALARSATTVARANGSPSRDSDLQRGLLEARLAAQQIEASAKALQLTDRALGSIIDTLA